METNLKKTVKVAVYGSLRKGLGNSGLLNTSKQIGRFETEPIYTMLDLGSFPGLIKNGTTSVIVEVYEVSADILRRLDQLEGFRGSNETNNFYNREKIETPYGEAYIYLLNRKNMGNTSIVKSGDWIDYIQAKQVRSLTL
jgi:gamma-glutamylcyclotransferase (GGCT)/AIG2-like uncharacterized protein YtfP